ncbi:TonB family protein [Rhodanobacter sp. MP7CTX1]|uniref:TonB family protein n=1 Tax=Rhodanobacter sp. MP7CTX1 TaxID=2723084 RepID=UPI00161B8432|nr:TonB family protein [Rhodanobacter sp. MP7CTX1]MBB6186523.1 TonB family protein [Rhodanobacter sp. MP7CTX1]
MDALPLILASAHLIGWTLVHFVWQGVLLGLVYAAVRAVLPRGEARYRFGMAMLIALALCPLLTVWRMLEAPSSVLRTAGAMVSSTAIGDGATGSAWTWDSGLDAALPWIVLAWSLGVLVLSLRAWQQWRGLKALVKMAEQLPMWQLRVNDMAERFGLRRRVTVLCSKVIATPALVGWMRPVILLPMAVACSFPVAQVELILAHELAHLRRWDPLANLFQVALETVYFYHPVVHWISRDVRNEREICSDELAISISGGDRHEFVAALAELGELRERHGSLLLAASGGVLLDRVQHMVVPMQEATRARTPARFVAVLLGAVLVSLTLRLEWKQDQLQRNLTDSIMQLQSMIAPSWLPLAQLHVAWHLSDLAPSHAVLARPLVDTPPVVAAPSPLASPSATTLAILPHPAPLLVSDLLPAHGVSLARLAEPVAPLASSVPSMPMPVRMRQPVYPQNALARGIEGQVVVEFGLAIDGSLRDLRVISAQPADVFDQAAIQAMRGWKYALPTDVLTQRRYRQTLVFTLNAAKSGTPSSTQAGDEVQARVGCRVATGTLICRLPGDTDSHAAGADEQ